MKIRILIILFLISFAFNMGIIVKVLFSAPGDQVSEVGCMHENWKESSVCLQLNLSCQQLEQVEKYRIQFQNRISPLTMKLEKEKLELFQLLKKNKLDEKEADKILHQISNHQNEIQKCFIHHFFQTKKIFDAHQQEKLYFYVQQCLYRGNQGSCCPQAAQVKVESKGREKVR